MNSDNIAKRIVADGGAPIAGGPDVYAINIANEEAKWAGVAKKLGAGAK